MKYFKKSPPRGNINVANFVSRTAPHNHAQITFVKQSCGKSLGAR